MGPFSIRYPRGNGVMIDWRKPFEAIPVGKGRKVRGGDGVAILSIGHPGNFAVEACDQLATEGIYPAHYDMRFVKPLDATLLHEIFHEFKKIVTIEDGCIQGGFGSAIAEFMIDHNYQAQIVRLGIPDEFIEHGEQKELYRECNFDVKAIVETVHTLVEAATVAH